jgi:hypothetical protein
MQFFETLLLQRIVSLLSSSLRSPTFTILRASTNSSPDLRYVRIVRVSLRYRQITSHTRGYDGLKLFCVALLCVTLRIIWHKILRDIWHNDGWS